MKQTLKRTVSALLALVMALALAACGGKTTPAASTPAASTPAASTPAASTPAAPAEPTKLVVGIAQNANVTSYEDNDFTRWLEEHANVKLEFVIFPTATADYRAQLTAMTAANEKLPHVLIGFNLTGDQILQYGMDGFFVDIKDYLRDKTLTAKLSERVDRLFGAGTWEDVLDGLVSPDGAIYRYPGLMASVVNVPVAYASINKTWLDKLGLQMPTNYQELVTVLRAFKTGDPNGNGKADEIPMVSRTSSNSNMPLWIINNFEFVNDSYNFSIKDGKLFLPYTTDGYRKGLQALYDLVQEGLLSDLTWTMKANSEMIALFTPADETAIVGVAGGSINTFVTVDNPVLYQYEPLDPFKYGMKAYTGMGIIAAASTFITESAVKDGVLDACFRMCMTMGDTDETTLVERYGVEGRDWEWTTDVVSGKPALKILNANAYTGSNNITWSTMHCMAAKFGFPDGLYTAVTSPLDKLSWSDDRALKLRRAASGYIDAVDKNNPKEILYGALVYNEQEADLIGTKETDVKAFMSKARAEFATGVRDPYSDKDWNAYVKEFESLGAADWTKAAQSAYDRMTGK